MGQTIFLSSLFSPATFLLDQHSATVLMSSVWAPHRLLLGHCGKQGAGLYNLGLDPAGKICKQSAPSNHTKNFPVVWELSNWIVWEFPYDEFCSHSYLLRATRPNSRCWYCCTKLRFTWDPSTYRSVFLSTHRAFAVVAPWLLNSFNMEIQLSPTLLSFG